MEVKSEKLDLKIVLSNISERWKYKMDEISPGVFRLDVAMKQKDESMRYQYVYAWEIKERYHGKDVFYFNSRCGEYNLNLNLYQMMKESSYCTYCSVIITTDKRTDGTPCETVVVHAVQPIELTSEAIINEVIWDVATNADIIEMTYFGGDNN
jgi:hypothetical protein